MAVSSTALYFFASSSNCVCASGRRWCSATERWVSAARVVSALRSCRRSCWKFFRLGFQLIVGGAAGGNHLQEHAARFQVVGIGFIVVELNDFKGAAQRPAGVLESPPVNSRTRLSPNSERASSNSVSALLMDSSVLTISSRASLSRASVERLSRTATSLGSMSAPASDLFLQSLALLFAAICPATCSQGTSSG